VNEANRIARVLVQRHLGELGVLGMLLHASVARVILCFEESERRSSVNRRLYSVASVAIALNSPWTTSAMAV
jgi:hypothetical protein